MFNRRYWSFARVPARIFLVISCLSRIFCDLMYISDIFDGPRYFIIRLCQRLLTLQLFAYFTGDILYCHMKDSRLALWLNYGIWTALVLYELLDLVFYLYF